MPLAYPLCKQRFFSFFFPFIFQQTVFISKVCVDTSFIKNELCVGIAAVLPKCFWSSLGLVRACWRPHDDKTPGLGVPLLLPPQRQAQRKLGLRGDLQNTGIGMGGELLVTTEMSWDLCRFSLLTDPLSLPISWCSVSNSSDGLLSATNWGQTRSFGVLSWPLPSAVVLFPRAWHWPGCSFSCRSWFCSAGSCAPFSEQAVQL